MQRVKVQMCEGEKNEEFSSPLCLFDEKGNNRT